MTHYWYHLAAFIVSALVVLWSTPLIKKFGLKRGLVDKPGGRKIHSRPMVRLGGVAIFAGTLAALLIVWWTGGFGILSPQKEYEVWGVTLGGVAFRQSMNFVNQKNRYMVVMAQNLYFHSMADNRGVALKLADRAAEEETKEDILLYSVLAKEPAKRSDLKAIDAAIEKYLCDCFGITVDFDVDDALSRLLADGLVVEQADGTLATMRPGDAALHIDKKWDVFLDDLPDFGEGSEGREVDSGSAPVPPGSPA